jgi:hypothetical protein
MNNESRETPPSLENEPQLLEREIRQALSATWPKSVQELLPGYLPDRPIAELSKAELASYRSAYALLGELVKKDEVEVVFVEESATTPADLSIENEYKARPKFKLKTNGGKREHNEGFFWQGNAVADPTV